MTQTIQEHLSHFEDPVSGRPILEVGKIRELGIHGSSVAIQITLHYPFGDRGDEIRAAVEKHVTALDGIDKAVVDLDFASLRHQPQGELKPLERIRNIIAVASGKGGVGKSTVSANLAAALAALGAKVGILDADMYGPSQPRMMGIPREQAKSEDEKTIEPLDAHGMQVMSIGFVIEEDAPIIWRGPMVTKALEQLLFETNWRPLDYLIVDLPPGTGDTQLSLAQKIPIAGGIIVTTPQQVALGDARKGLRMFQRVGIDVLGLIENMSSYVCPHCGTEEALFGNRGGVELAGEEGIALLEAIPLEPDVCKDADAGTPTVIAHPNSESARRFSAAAQTASIRLALRPRSKKLNIPKIKLA